MRHLKFTLIVLSALSAGLGVSAQAPCEITGTTPGEACMGGSGTVSATAKPGNTINWYDQQTGGNLLHTGASYTVNNVTTPAVFWAEATSGGAVVADSIDTQVPNNGQAGAYFDCKPLTDLTVTGFNFVPRGTATFTVAIYYKTGTFVGFEANSTAWTLLGTSPAFSATANVLTHIPLTLSQQLTANQTYAFYVIATAGSTLGYTNGTSVGTLCVSNSDIEVYEGKGSGGLFSTSLFTVRTFAGTIHYEKGSVCISPRVSAPLTTIDNTEITNQKTVDSSCTGLPTYFYVDANGDILNYRWQMFDQNLNDYVDITGFPFVNAGDTLFVVSADDTLNGAEIRCITVGKCGDDTSQAMMMVVSPLPSFISPPQDQTHDPGETAIFSVATAGVNVQYQWQVGYKDTFANINEGGIYKGVKTNTLRVFGVTRAQNEFQFRCIIKGSGSCSIEPDTSNFGMLYVNPEVSVEGLESDNSFVVYPSPATGNTIYIRTAATANAAGYRIADKMGRTVADGSLGSGGNTAVDISRLPAGVYTIQVTDGHNKLSGVTRFTRL